MLCKVALSETCHPSEIAKVEELFDTNLSLYNPHKVDSNLQPVFVSMPPVPPPPPSVGKSLRPPSPPPPRADLSDWEDGGKEDEKASVPSSRATRSRRKRKGGSSSSYSRSSSSSRSSSRSSRSSSRSRSRSRGRKRKRSGSSDSDRPKGEYSIFTSEMLARMKCEENSLFKEHGAAYEVYLEVPEMHPNYEDKYERFLQSYKKKYNTTAESEHMTKMWQKYWKLCIENIKGKDWKRKRKELLEKYKLEASAARSAEVDKRAKSSPVSIKEELPSSPAPTMSSAAVMAAISEISRQRLDNFTAAGAIELLEDLCANVGELGSSVVAMLSSVRQLGLSTRKAMDLVSAEENVVLLNSLFERLLVLRQSLSGPEAEHYKKGIAWGLHLIKHAKDFQEEDGKDHKVRFDANLFAQQTYNQDPTWIYETLEQSLEYVYGTKPSTDIVKQMFATVSTIHVNMSSSTPYLMSSGASVASGYASNPGIVSQREPQSTPAASSFSSIPLTPLIPSTVGSFSSYAYPQLATPLVHAAASGLNNRQSAAVALNPRTEASDPFFSSSNSFSAHSTSEAQSAPKPVQAPSTVSSLYSKSPISSTVPHPMPPPSPVNPLPTRHSPAPSPAS